jgi:hypothetical protein
VVSVTWYKQKRSLQDVKLKSEGGKNVEKHSLQPEKGAKSQRLRNKYINLNKFELVNRDNYIFKYIFLLNLEVIQ